MNNRKDSPSLAIVYILQQCHHIAFVLFCLYIRLCRSFQPFGSGYVTIKNLMNSSTQKYLYDKTNTVTEKCFPMDFTKPNHPKSSSPSYQHDPFDVGPRIQRHPNLYTTFHGWFDPAPNSQVTGPSGVHRYEIEVYGTQYNVNHIKKDMNIIASFDVPAGATKYDFKLPELLDDDPDPHLYCIELTTIDLARNPRYTRRFVLYDKSSYLMLDTHKSSLRPITANPAANYEWQVSLDVMVVDWKDYFYNSYYRRVNLLLPIVSDPQLDGVFNQLDEPLPITGTANVHGITQFHYRYDKYSPSQNLSAPFRMINLVTDERVSLNDLPLQDGDTVDVEILAMDIVDNTIKDSFRVYIDSSPPELENLGLMKDGERMIFVHSTIDLVKMDFVFDAFDPHSGIKRVLWRLGTTAQGSDIGQGALPVHRFNHSVSV